jgi:hypothetical protein
MGALVPFSLFLPRYGRKLVLLEYSTVYPAGIYQPDSGGNTALVFGHNIAETEVRLDDFLRSNQLNRCLG